MDLRLHAKDHSNDIAVTIVVLLVPNFNLVYMRANRWIGHETTIKGWDFLEHMISPRIKV